MRHRLKGKKLSRDAAHRKALYRNLVSSMVKYGSVETTLAKAKAVKPLVERLVTEARRGDLAASRRMFGFFYEKELARKFLQEIAPRFKGRAGGYTRIIKLGPRRTDLSEMARLEFVEGQRVEKKAKVKKGSKK